ncbi:MAG TPA: hypothetical protein DCY35_06240 [Prolixibacteraceae bacterium]|nr:hypothetical protein [Prolixibacteraceae bacterium]
MKKLNIFKLIRLVLACFPIVAMACACMAKTKGEVIYVALNGDDQKGDGSISKPFATVERARNDAKTKKGDITVYLRGGTYHISSPITFDGTDSGKGGTITYTSYPREQATISGGKKITGFTEREDGLWVANIPEVREGKLYFEQLWVDGDRAVRARTPNKGEYYFINVTAGSHINPKTAGMEDLSYNGFMPSEDDIMPKLSKMSKRKLQDVLVHTYLKWSVGRQLIDFIIPEKDIIVMSGKRETLNPEHYQLSRGTRYYLENYFEALDIPGEWFLSRDGELFYRPLPKQTISNTEFYVPIAEQLILINGDRYTNTYVENITFKNLKFKHTNYITSDEGWGQRQSAPRTNGAIRMAMAKNIEISDCDLRNLAETAIVIDQGNYDIKIHKNYMTDMGAGGIRVGEDVGAAPTKVSQNMMVKNVVIDNNIITGGGRIYENASAILFTQVGDSRISHNDISDFYYIAIGVGWNWIYQPTSTHNNVIEYNRIRGIGQGVMNDMGGIYTLGESYGTIIRNNIIHDVYRYSYGYGGFGIYNDQASKGILMENNLVYNTNDACYFLNWGQENTVRNNIFAYNDSGAAISGGSNEYQGSPSSGIFEKNIILLNNGEAIYGGYLKPGYLFDKNCYINLSNKESIFMEHNFIDWQEKGRDIEGMYIKKDPFEKMNIANFKIIDDLIMKKTGFKEFNYLEAGVYGDDDWVEKGKMLTIPQPIVVKNILYKRLSINMNFDDLPIGASMPFAALKTSPDATFTVSNEEASSGRQSLKITDTIQTSKQWVPSMEFDTGFKNGIVILEYDIKFKDNKFDFSNNWQDRTRTQNQWTTALKFSFEDNGLKMSNKNFVKPPKSVKFQ